MINELDKKILKLKLQLAGYISNINIKHENLEGKYIKLVQEVDKLEERLRDLERDISSIVFRAVRNTLVALGGIITTIYGVIRILDYMIKAVT